MQPSKNLNDALDSVREISELYKIKTICFSCDDDVLGVCHTLNTIEDFERMSRAIYTFLEGSLHGDSTQHNISGVLINAVTNFLTKHPEILF